MSSILYKKIGLHDSNMGQFEITITLDELPSHVGIDPYNKLVDRNSDDNVKSVE